MYPNMNKDTAMSRENRQQETVRLKEIPRRTATLRP